MPKSLIVWLLVFLSSCASSSLITKTTSHDSVSLTIELDVKGDPFDPKTKDQNTLRCKVSNRSDKSQVFFEDYDLARMKLYGKGVHQRMAMDLVFSDFYYEERDPGIKLNPGQSAVIFEVPLIELISPPTDTVRWSWNSRHKARPDASPLLENGSRPRSTEFWFTVDWLGTELRSDRVMLTVKADEQR